MNILFYFRHSSTGFYIRPQCEHKNANQRQYQCSSLSMQDVKRAHQIFYEVPDKVKQDQIILRYVVLNSVKRNRSRKDLFKKQVSIKYFVPKLNEDKLLQNVLVCKQVFTNIFGLSKKRVDLVR